MNRGARPTNIEAERIWIKSRREIALSLYENDKFTWYQVGMSLKVSAERARQIAGGARRKRSTRSYRKQLKSILTIAHAHAALIATADLILDKPE